MGVVIIDQGFHVASFRIFNLKQRRTREPGFLSSRSLVLCRSLPLLSPLLEPVKVAANVRSDDEGQLLATTPNGTANVSSR